MWRPTSHRACSRSLVRRRYEKHIPVYQARMLPAIGAGHAPVVLRWRAGAATAGRQALRDARFRSSYKRDLLARRPSLDGLNPTHIGRYAIQEPDTHHDQPGTLLYWITSSARSSNDCGIVRPSAFAVFSLSPARTCNAVRPVHYRTDRQKMVAHTLAIAMAHGVGNDRHSPDGPSTNAFAIQGNASPGH
jgi:hypothetical protein